MVAKVIILGHGGFDQGEKEILVGTGQSLTFYSDAGSELALPAARAETGQGEHGHEDLRFDYEKVRDALSKYTKQQEAINGAVIYNFALSPLGEDSRNIAKKLEWGGEVVTPESGEELKLCAGDESTCPTPALRAKMDKFVNGEEGGEDVPDDKWVHTCGGILGKHKDDEIHWVSCTGFTFDTSNLPPEITDPTEGPGS